MRQLLIRGVLAAALLLAAGCGGTPSSNTPTALEASPRESKSLEIVVGESFLDFVSSLATYTRIEPDTQNPLTKFDETRDAFFLVRSEYFEFRDNLDLIENQEQLGSNGADLQRMQALIPVADLYFLTQKNFYESVGECADLPGGLSSPDCDTEALADLEKTARDAIPPFVEAMDAVMESIPQSNE